MLFSAPIYQALRLIILLFISTSLWARPLAVIDRSLWPYEINTSAAFDRASVAEALSFTHVLTVFLETIHHQDPEQTLQEWTGLERVNLDSVQSWVERTQEHLLRHYQTVHPEQGVDTWSQLVLTSQQAGIGENQYQAWYQASQGFYQAYLAEQLRLAALFPRITSEIDQLHPAELQGFEFADRQFLLTYDDGPHSRTADLIDALEAANLHAFFFVLGENLAQRNPAEPFYRNQCLGSHGEQHFSHARQAWQTSIETMHDRLSNYQTGPYWFRPPYGQRNLELTEYLIKQGAGLMLWNIDSQDWNRRLTNAQIRDRVITLMLVWRKGIILYHDIHTPALDNLPNLIDFAAQTEVQWVNCHHLAFPQ